MVLMGSKDPDFKDQQAEARLVEGRMHGEVRMVEGAGHYPHAEMPEQARSIIIEYFARLAGQIATVTS